jgi:hypothetical protein
MGILPDNVIDVLVTVWLEWMMYRAACWSVYGQLVDRDR